MFIPLYTIMVSQSHEAVTRPHTNHERVGLVVVIPPTRRSPERVCVFSEWQNLPKSVHENAQVHFDNGDGWVGPVRTKASNDATWSYLKRGKPRGKSGSARKFEFSLFSDFLGKYKKYGLHQLVCMAFHGLDPSSDFQALHISRREVDTRPNDAASNLYVGTDADNKADRAADNPGSRRRGRSRGIIGQRAGDSTWTEFSSGRDAADGAKISISYVSRAIQHGLTDVGPNKWTFSRPMMDVSHGTLISEPFSITQSGRKVVLSDGRVGEYKNVAGGHVLVPVEYATDSGGYARVGYALQDGTKRIVPLHRLIIELLAPERITEAESRTERSWHVTGDLDVDHMDGDATNNRLDNLRVLSRQEHRDKDAYAVRATSASTGEVVGVYVSAGEAGRDLGVWSGNIRLVCIGEQITTGGYIFSYVDRQAVEDHRLNRKRKRDSHALP